MASLRSSDVPVPANRHFDLFDSLRAIAALCVLLFHSAGWARVNVFEWYGAFTSKLNVGVTLFFLISGFLLYRPHAVELLGGRSAPALRDYCVRRALRILPAYWFALTLLALWPGLKGVFTREWWAYYGLLQSYRRDWSLGGLGVEWSLSVELAFYALLPFVARPLVWAGKRVAPPRALLLQLLVFAALGAMSLAFRAWIHGAGNHDLYNSLPANLLGFLVGMALAAVSARLEGRDGGSRGARLVARHPGWCWAAAAAIFAAVALSPAFPRPFSDVRQSTAAFTAESVLFSAIALLVMLPAVFSEEARGLPRRLLSSPFLTWVGKGSYGIFLWHLPLLGALRAAFFVGVQPTPAFVGLTLAILPLAVGLGWLSWRFVEAPALRLARGLGARGSLAAAGATAAPAEAPRG